MIKIDMWYGKEEKKYITLEEAPIVREIIASMKEDESTVEEYAEMAIRVAYDGNAWNIDTMKASAKIAKNCRAWNVYSDNSNSIDIWIEATAYVNNDEFIMIGAYLSDIWQISGDNQKEIASHMYIKRFKEMK